MLLYYAILVVTNSDIRGINCSLVDLFWSLLDREVQLLIKIINEIWDKIYLRCVDWVTKLFLLLQVRTTQLVSRTAAVEEGDEASLLFSLPPHPETLHVNSVTVCVLPHQRPQDPATGDWGRGTSVSAAQTQSRTSSANPSALLPVQTLMSCRYAAHTGPR